MSSGVPDFVLVREVQNPVTGIKHLETIIVDAKLSASTGWTKNQTAAQKMSGWKVKSAPSDPIIGNKLTGFGKSVAVNNKQSFLKLYKNNNIAKVL